MSFALAYRAALQAMDEPFPERPALFLDFVLPSGSKDLFLNLGIAEPHTSTPRLPSIEDPKVFCKGAAYEVFAVETTSVAIRPFTLLDLRQSLNPRKSAQSDVYRPYFCAAPETSRLQNCVGKNELRQQRLVPYSRGGVNLLLSLIISGAWLNAVHLAINISEKASTMAALFVFGLVKVLIG